MYKKMLIPVDRSSASQLAARAGLTFASSLGAEAILLHVAANAGADPAMSSRSVIGRANRRQQGFLMELAAEAVNAGTRCTTMTVLYDEPWESIVAVARRRGCDLIFIGSHRRGLFGRLVFGSVAAQVLSESDVPVLVHPLYANTPIQKRKAVQPEAKPEEVSSEESIDESIGVDG